MKKRLWKYLLLCLVLMNGLSSLAWAANLQDYTLAQENEFLRLYVQEETAEFAVEDIASGEVWFSTPQNLNLERIKRGNARNAMRSLINLNYFTPARDGKSLSSYVDSVLNEEFTVTITPEEVRFDFTLGKMWPESAHYPRFIAKDKFEAILEKVEDPFDRDILLDSYSLLSFEERDYDPYERISVFGLDLPTFFGNYELELLSGSLLQKKLGLRNEPHERTKYYFERLADTMVGARADVERRGLLTAKDFDFVFRGPFYALLDDTYKVFNRPEFARIFSEVGYTPQDVEQDHQLHNIDPPRPNPEVFQIPLVLKLDGPSLLATVPAGEILYPVGIPNDKGVLETFYPYSIDLLPYFGVAHERTEGYIFVPERSGALIAITNPKKNSLPAYSGSVYGVDRAIAPQIEKIAQGPQIRMPVFGLKEGDRAFFTIIEEGATLAYVNGESAGRAESFAKVYARFALTPRASITLFGVESSLDNKMVDAYAVQPYQGHISERIVFLTGDQADYVGMAQHYRGYLVQRHGLKRIDSTSEVPLVVEVLGGFHDFEPVYGAPREVIRPMTTYQGLVTLLQDLESKSVPTVRVRYLGWSKGGIEHTYPDRVALEKTLGSAEDFRALLDYVNNSQVELYLDVDFNAVYRDNLFDGFKSGRDASRYLNRTAVKIWEYNIATFQRTLDRQAYAVSPRVLPGLVDSFLKSFASYDGANLALRSLGNDVYSDFIDKKDKMVHRPEALAIALEQMGKIQGTGRNIMAVGGNDAVIPYATQIVEAPEATSPLLIIDQNVPFYQMVLHGYVDYSSQPYNKGGITQDQLLRSLETGELPFFRWSLGNSSAIKGTNFEHLLTTNYHDLGDVGLTLYWEVAPILAKVRGQVIINHEELQPAVFRTTYENGVEIIVNYNAEGVWYGGNHIPGRGYIVVERGLRR